MNRSKYERFVVRSSTPPDPSLNWGRPELGITDLYHFLKPDGPIKESDTMVEYAWITKDSAFGVTEDKPPHSHDCDEIFLFMGTNPQQRDELGGEVEFWMGQGDDTERITLTTSGLIFVPGRVVHLPIFFKKVRTPLLWIVVGLSIGQTLGNTTKHPIRGL